MVLLSFPSKRWKIDRSGVEGIDYDDLEIEGIDYEELGLHFNVDRGRIEHLELGDVCPKRKTNRDKR